MSDEQNTINDIRVSALSLIQDDQKPISVQNTEPRDIQKRKGRKDSTLPHLDA